MANIDTEALVLRSYNLADADKIVVFITKDQGLVKGVAKGAKRLKSKFGSTLEPFSVVNLSYFQKEERELVNIKQIDLVNSFFKNTSEIDFLNKFEYIAELLIFFSPPHDPNERLYNMSKVCLESASENSDSLETITLYFEIWILKLSGFLPSWENCNKCNRVLIDGELANIQFDSHLLCNNCQNFRNNNTISPFQRNSYLLAQRVSPKRFIDFAEGNVNEIIELSQKLKQIISKVLGKESVGEKIYTARFK